MRLNLTAQSKLKGLPTYRCVVSWCHPVSVGVKQKKYVRNITVKLADYFTSGGLVQLHLEPHISSDRGQVSGIKTGMEEQLHLNCSSIKTNGLQQTNSE